EELQGQFGESPEFFDNDAMVVDLAGIGEADVDFDGLLKLLRAYRVVPVAIKNGSEAHKREALRAGLASADDAALTAAVSRRDREEQPQLQAPLAVPATIPATALVIDKPLRSGQQVYARGRDLVV